MEQFLCNKGFINASHPVHLNRRKIHLESTIAGEKSPPLVSVITSTKKRPGSVVLESLFQGA